VTGYLVTESATTPAANDNGWSATPQSSFTFSGYGARTAYAWVKDTAGTVSAALSATVTIDTPPVVSSFTMRPMAFGGGSTIGGWTVTNLSQQLKDSLPSTLTLIINNGAKGYSSGSAISNSGLIAGVGYTKLAGVAGNRTEAVYWNLSDGSVLDLGFPLNTSAAGRPVLQLQQQRTTGRLHEDSNHSRRS
jgi:hypothetical protein